MNKLVVAIAPKLSQGSLLETQNGILLKTTN
jgi:hypothetical protein